MKIRDDDPFFTLDIPVLRIRSSTPAEAARRAERWASSRARKLRSRVDAAAKADRRASRQVTTVDQSAEPERLPWREIWAAWRNVRATYDGLFLDEDEEELARLAFQEGGRKWLVVLKALAERKRDREAEVRSRYLRGAI